MSTVLVLVITAPAGILAALTLRSLARDVRRLLASPPSHDDYSHIHTQQEGEPHDPS